MGNLYNHYSQGENERERRLKEISVKQYNYWTETLTRVFKAMTAKAQEVPPSRCDWVYENGNKIVSWQLTTDVWDEHRFINLTPDGRLLSTSGKVAGGPCVVVRELHLRRVNSLEELTPYSISYEVLSNLFKSVASSGMHFFGLPTGDLLDHTSQQWPHTHPEDDPSKW